MPPQNKENRRKGKKSNVDVDDEEYRRRRDKNNLAVKRSRDKTKQKTKQTLDRVVQLKSENETLEEKIKLLTKELSFLKDLFLAHAGTGNGIDVSKINLAAILQEDQDASSSAIRELIEESEFKFDNNQCCWDSACSMCLAYGQTMEQVWCYRLKCIVPSAKDINRERLW